MAKRFNIGVSVVVIGTCLIIGFQLMHGQASAADSKSASADSAPSQSTPSRLTGPSKTVLEY